MIAELDVCIVICPSERSYLGPEAAFWTPRPALAAVFTRDRALELSLSVEWPHGRRHIEIRPVAVCACCGKHALETKLKRVAHGPPPQWRCERHIDRNPCIVPGCGRTTAGRQPSLDNYICGRHWRTVPQRMKLIYRRLWRLQKKSGGWTDLLVARYWRIWGRIRKAAIDASRGDVDMNEVAAMFGWDD